MASPKALDGRIPTLLGRYLNSTLEPDQTTVGLRHPSPRFGSESCPGPTHGRIKSSASCSALLGNNPGHPCTDHSSPSCQGNMMSVRLSRIHWPGTR